MRVCLQYVGASKQLSAAFIPSLIGTPVAARSIVVDRDYRGPERRADEDAPEDVAPVRLTRKYAEAINGVDLSHNDVGDRMPLPARDARLLVAEGWAEPERSRSSDRIRRRRP
jgi:hypothetical protein